MSELTYIPVDAPQRPFEVGDVVEVLDRHGEVLSEQQVLVVGPRRLRTACGRTWTPAGEWTTDGGRTSYPFPSIRLKSVDGGAKVAQGTDGSRAKPETPND